MAVINFPDPAGQNPVNTFGPNTTPFASANGTTYEYTNGSWTIAGSGGNSLNEGLADSRYVNVDGDNMTDDLTLGPVGSPQITLGVDGSADFAGNVNVTPDNGVNGILLANNGAFVANTTNTTSASKQFILNSAGDEKFVVRADGSASFAGNVQCGQAGNTAYLRANGMLLSNRDTGTKTAFEAQTAGVTTVLIYADGSANFSGNVSGNVVSGVILEAQPTTRKGSNCIAAKQPADAAVTDKVLQLRHDNPAGNGELLRGRNASDTETVSIKADGSATFAKRVQAERFKTIRVSTSAVDTIFEGVSDFGAPGRTSILITADGRIRVGGENISAESNIDLKNDGSANFAGNVDVGPVDLNADTGVGVRSFNNGIIRVQRPTSTANPSNAEVFTTYLGRAKKVIMFANGDITSPGTIGFNLEPDNPANYTTTTDAEGNETQVYNGPTLDVKERLQTKTAALEAIKTAAEDASITTLADFKSAIATALANI